MSKADTSLSRAQGLSKSHDILTCTIRNPPYSYVRLQSKSSDPSKPTELDELQVKSYCTAALQQFLGLAGAAVSVDVLKVEEDECWVRVPCSELGAFSAAITSWRGASDGAGEQMILRVMQCSDWLGTMVGTKDQDSLWEP